MSRLPGSKLKPATNAKPSVSAKQAPSKQRAHAPDYLLLTTVLVLAVIGLIAVYSASYALGEAQFDDPNYFVKRQGAFLVVGIVVMFVTMRFPYHLLRGLSPLLMLFSLVGLMAVLLIGHESNGAQRWISLGSGLPPLQPSEFAKFAVLVYMAAWLSAKGEVIHDVSLGVLPFVGMVGLIGALIMAQPDLGTAIMVAAITGTLFFVAGARLFHVMVLAATGMFATLVLILTGGYRMDRITAFLDAESDPTGVGFHAIQLLVAFGSGGFTGLGLGVSRQKFFYVPGSHTDGILAIIGEELGYIGVSVVMLLFLVMLVRILLVARRSDTQFGSLIAMGIWAWIAFQMLINVGGVLRLMPLTGIPLPFVSYGGTALLTLFFAMGVLLGVSRYTVTAEGEQPAEVRGVRRPSSPSTPASRPVAARPTSSRPAQGGSR
ncbi:MAG: putative lipid II flippase FtsW [Dehalococcoidia bacterium]|nr:putative lipid II flippase FtsW [Dehalococcoidia bacterium]